MNNLFRWGTALVFGAVITYVIWSKDDVSIYEGEKPLQRKYGTIISPDLLMTVLLFLFIRFQSTPPLLRSILQGPL